MKILKLFGEQFSNVSSLTETDKKSIQEATVCHICEKDMSDYSDLYLKTDVLLLSDIFGNFPKCLFNNLDPAHYYTARGLSRDTMLKFTQLELELLTNFDMIAFIKSVIRDGVAQCSNRYAKANYP